jgi:hypothetical protein
LSICRSLPLMFTACCHFCCPNRVVISTSACLQDDLIRVVITAINVSLHLEALRSLRRPPQNRLCLCTLRCAYTRRCLYPLTTTALYPLTITALYPLTITALYPLTITALYPLTITALYPLTICIRGFGLVLVDKKRGSIACLKIWRHGTRPRIEDSQARWPPSYYLHLSLRLDVQKIGAGWQVVRCGSSKCIEQQWSVARRCIRTGAVHAAGVVHRHLGIVTHV